jgi:hypothetical protein
MTATTPTGQTPADTIPADTVTAVLAAHPGATAAELAEEAGIGRSTAAKRLAALEQQGTARRSAGGRDGGHRLPDRWHLADNTDDPRPADAGSKAGAEVPDDALAASGHGDGDGTEPAEAGAVRLGKGGLRSLVLDYVADHTGAEGLSPTAVAKGLGGRSSGAVGNALQRLEADGAVRLVNQAPRRYATVG